MNNFLSFHNQNISVVTNFEHHFLTRNIFLRSGLLLDGTSIQSDRTFSKSPGQGHYCPQTKFAKAMFLHLSVSHSVHRGGYLGRYPPGQVHPPGQAHPGQVHPQAGTPLGRYTPPGRYTPWAGAPPGRYTPWAGTPPGQVHPGQVHPLGRYTPQADTPYWAGTPPR